MIVLANNRQEFEQYFRKEILPDIQSTFEKSGRPDYPRRRQEWNDLIDALTRSSMLPSKAVDWVSPW